LVDELERGWQFAFADRSRLHAGGLVNDEHPFFPVALAQALWDAHKFATCVRVRVLVIDLP
jgi:hypothetical protein